VQWSAIAARPWPAILIGNGASIAVWSRFDYASLYHVAATGRCQHPLNADDRALFKQFTTENFEVVLEKVRAASIASSVYLSGAEAARFKAPYDRIRRALGSAVQAVHPSYGVVGTSRLRAMGAALRQYAWVFSTNYDLLIYWSMMTFGRHGFYDFMGGSPCGFRTSHGPGRADRTNVLYLHGALHLYVPTNGPSVKMTLKRVRVPMASLLDQLLTKRDAPLVVTEGTARDKKGVIDGSDYLKFALNCLDTHRDPLVVFGAALGDSDGHIVEALLPTTPRRYAIGVRGTIARQNIAISRYRASLPGGDLQFFHADTHPLGHPRLRVRPVRRTP
jgi:hypothetical protein